MPDREIDHCLKSSPVAFCFYFRRGHIGAAIGINNDVRPRLIDLESPDIHHFFQAGQNLQVHLDQLRVQERRGTGRLGAVNHEIGNGGPHVRPIKVEGTDIYFAPRGFLGGRDDLLADEVVEPVRPHHENACDGDNENECNE